MSVNQCLWGKNKQVNDCVYCDYKEYHFVNGLCVKREKGIIK